MSGQKPSVGRIVHYVSHGSPVRVDGSQAFASQCRAAIITEVAHPGQVLLTNADGLEHSSDEVVVGLCVLNPTGQFFDRAAQHEGDTQVERDERTNVEVFSRSYKGGSWHWPERA